MNEESSKTRGPAVRVLSGKLFYPLDPTPDEIEWTDIAASLSKLCRYNGHTSGFYSVAEHCILLADAVPEEFALEALLHDAAEAYVGDLVAPIKSAIPQFEEIELKILSAIRVKAGLPDAPLSPTVAEYDIRIRTDEVLSLNILPWPGMPEALDVKINCYPPQFAQLAYLLRLDRFGVIKIGD